MGIGDWPKFFAAKPLDGNFLAKFREAFRRHVFHPIEIREGQNDAEKETEGTKETPKVIPET